MDFPWSQTQKNTQPTLVNHPHQSDEKSFAANTGTVPSQPKSSASWRREER